MCKVVVTKQAKLEKREFDMSNIIGTHANKNGETVKVFAGIYDLSGWDSIAEYINEMELGTVFSVQRLGLGVVNVVEHHDDVLAFSEFFGYEPEKLDEPGFNIQGYEPLKGLTRQHGYDGAMMHISEFFSGGLASMCAEMGGKFYLDYAEYETLEEQITNDIANGILASGVESIWELEGYDVEPAGWFLMHKADD